MLTDLWYRLRGLFTRSAMDRELDEELRFHVDREIEKLLARGVPLPQATREARLRLGGITQVSEHVRDSRGLNLFDRFGQDIRYALRFLRRTPAFSLAVVLTLGVGIGATTTMFAVIDGLIFRALPYPDSDRLVQIGATFGPVHLSSISTIDFKALRSRSQTLEIVAGARSLAVTATISGDRKSTRLNSSHLGIPYAVFCVKKKKRDK